MTITAVTGDVVIDGEIAVGTTYALSWNNNELQGDYNSLTITAGGGIREAGEAKITAPVVKTSSGKGVSLESANNRVNIFLAEALEGSDTINGSVKAVSNYADAEDGFTVGVGADIIGDAEFTNLDSNGGLSALIWHFTDDNKEIKILEGNNAKGNLVLKANKNVNLLGDANAAHDIVIESADGLFSGIGHGMKAGNDVTLTVGDGAYYLGGDLNAGNDILVRVLKPVSKGVYIGALPLIVEDGDNGGNTLQTTSLTANREVRFEVQGAGDIALKGNISAGNGDVVANIGGKGNITIAKSIESKNESVSLKTKEGNIVIGGDNGSNEETIKAKKNATIGTELGTITIQGKTITETGDITMTAGNATYDQTKVNFIITGNGQLDSGKGITLNGRNGDVRITNNISAKESLAVNIAEQGNVSFERDVAVTKDVTISTDKGDIEVGKTINAGTGIISLQTGNGDILVGQDITAGQDITIYTHKGEVGVGYESLGSEGNVLSRTGNVSIRTDEGPVGILKSVKAQEGGIDIEAKGAITVGAEVQAKTDIAMTADGVIDVDAAITAAEGDVTLDTANDDITVGANVQAGKDVAMTANNGAIKVDFAVTAIGGKATLDTVNGAITVGAGVWAGKDVAMTANNGAIKVESAVTAVGGKATLDTVDGAITIGAGVQAADDVTMTADKGTIDVEAAVTSNEGKVMLDTNQGYIWIGQDITAGWDVTIHTHKGPVVVGYASPGSEADGDVLAKAGNVSIKTDEGTVSIFKSVMAMNKGRFCSYCCRW